MKRALAALAVACSISIAACGGTTAHHTTHKQISVRESATLAHRCPANHATMGCASRPPTTASLPVFAASGCKIPDVSSYQGHPGWAAARGSICGAIFKGGEYTQDPDAAYNNSTLRSLGIWRAMYWFVRNTGCSSEANQIITLARSFGLRVVVNDLEVPEAAGYGGCLVPAEKAAGLIPVDYTAPGTWPGGSGFGGAPLWQAEYGPTLHAFWSPVVAWQCTDGQFGCVTRIPGVPLGDVSVNMGVTSLGAAPKPRTICWGKGSTPKSAACVKIEAQAKHYWQQYLAFHNGLVRHQKQLAVVSPYPGYFQQTKPSISVPAYKGPSIGYLNGRIATESKWAAIYKARHDALVHKYSPSSTAADVALRHRCHGSRLAIVECLAKSVGRSA